MNWKDELNDSGCRFLLHASCDGIGLSSIFIFFLDAYYLSKIKGRYVSSRIVVTRDIFLVFCIVIHDLIDLLGHFLHIEMISISFIDKDFWDVEWQDFFAIIWLDNFSMHFHFWKAINTLILNIHQEEKRLARSSNFWINLKRFEFEFDFVGYIEVEVNVGSCSIQHLVEEECNFFRKLKILILILNIDYYSERFLKRQSKFHATPPIGRWEYHTKLKLST